MISKYSSYLLNEVHHRARSPENLAEEYACSQSTHDGDAHFSVPANKVGSRRALENKWSFKSCDKLVF